MRGLGLLLFLVACGSGPSPIIVYDPDAGPIVEQFDLAAPDLTWLPDDNPGDPCGPKSSIPGAYECAYLVGGCPSPGLACYCWENGTMVCQANHQWELIGDRGCPYFAGQSGTSYQGLGCLGGQSQCGACSCDPKSSVYECADGG